MSEPVHPDASGDETILNADFAEVNRIERVPTPVGGLFASPDLNRATHLPPWFQEFQSAAWHTFEALPSPTRTEQAWRFASLYKVKLEDYQPALPIADGAAAPLVARSRGNAESAGRMVFGNDTLLSREVLDAKLEGQGVLWLPLERAMTEREDIFRQHFMTQEILLGSKRFAALHAAHVRTGTFLYVPANVEVALPLETFHWLSGEAGSVFPHTLIVAEAGAKVTLVDYFESDRRAEPGFACAVNDLIVGPGAKVTYLCAQNWGEQVTSFQINTTAVGRDGQALSLHLNLGARYARLESLSRLLGAGGRSDMLAATVASADQEFDQRTLQDHVAPHTNSDLLYKNSLSDTARAIFAGLIRVEPDAQHTDAYQKVRNLLLSDEAEANSMPGLEILADEVRCTHGATSGSVEPEEMFYLLSRGIDAPTARRLITLGFLAEALDRLPDPSHAGRLRELLEAKFARMRDRPAGGTTRPE